jgi:protein SCO1/2
MKKLFTVLVVVSVVIFGSIFLSFADIGVSTTNKQPSQPPYDKKNAFQDIGIEEHLGSYLPDNITFYDSNGEKVNIKEIIRKAPTIIAPVYFTCPNVCNILQSTIVNLIPQLNLIPGKDYQILSVSFDERDNIQVAKEKKANYMMALNNSFPPEYWRFLTGDQNNIRKIMDAIGFKFRREGNDFIHGVVVVVVSPDGKIVRYIYGTRILPFDITMAITEAQKGLPGLSVKRVLNYCFSYDPSGKKYVFNIMKVSGTIIIIALVTMFLVLTLKGKRNTRRGKYE